MGAPVDQISLTERYTDRAAQLIEKNWRNPFFLYLVYMFPHSPHLFTGAITRASNTGSRRSMPGKVTGLMMENR